MTYVIYKSSRAPTDQSYSGPTWDVAGIRHRYKRVYDDIREAEELAVVLTSFNGVGFKVSPIEK